MEIRGLQGCSGHVGTWHDTVGIRLAGLLGLGECTAPK